MNEFWNLLNEDEKVYEYFREGNIEIFNDEDQDEELKNIEAHGRQMAKEAAEASTNTKNLFEYLALEKLAWLPMSLRDLTLSIHYDPRCHDKIEVVKMEEINEYIRETEKILFFETLPTLKNAGKIASRDVLRLGERENGREYVYYMKK